MLSAAPPPHAAQAPLELSETLGYLGDAHLLSIKECLEADPPDVRAAEEAERRADECHNRADDIFDHSDMSAHSATVIAKADAAPPYYILQKKLTI